MISSELIAKYKLDHDVFNLWLQESGLEITQLPSGAYSIPVGYGISEEAVVQRFKQVEATYVARLLELNLQRLRDSDEMAAKKIEEENIKKQALAKMLITSGFNFDGYKITKYSGYISGDDAISMDRPTQGFWGNVNGDVGADLLAGLVHIRRRALAELKEAAYALGCNAVIGVDFDYITLDPETATGRGGTLYLPFLFAVTANGNAVVIEKC